MKTLAVYTAGVLTGILAAYIFVKLNYEFKEDIKEEVKKEEDLLGMYSPSKEFAEIGEANKEILFNAFDDNSDTPPIFCIDEDEFYNPMTYDSGKYDKVTIKYDVDNDIFLDEDGSIINDTTIFGGLDKSMAFYHNSDVFYIRNEILDIDYEIVKDRSFEFNRSVDDESYVD